MMTNEQKAELGSMVEQLSQSFQDSYDADLDLLTRRDKAHVKRIGELEADNARLVAQVEALQAELAEAKRWVPAPDGQVPESNLWIASAHGDGWFLEFGKNGAKVWFPGVVRLHVDSTHIKIDEATQ